MAASTRTSTFSVWELPTGSNSPSCRTRNSFAWSSRGNSPTSSRKIVLPSASVNLPSRLVVAPVKAPFSWPNNSLSMRFSGIAAQFTLISGLSFRLLAAWMALAITSLPVPVSPNTSTDVSVGATWWTSSKTLNSGLLSPIISSKFCSSLISSRKYSVSTASERIFCSASILSFTFLRITV